MRLRIFSLLIITTTNLKQNQNTNQWPDELDALIASPQHHIFTNLPDQANKLEQNQNTNKHLPLQEAIPLQAQQVSEPPFPGLQLLHPLKQTGNHNPTCNLENRTPNSRQTSMELHKHPHHVTHKEVIR